MRINSASKSAELSSGVKINDGFTVQQWVLLVFAFFLGIASVMTIDKVFLSNSGHAGAAHAGVILENGANPTADK
ncbi:MAG: hypothetical protein LBH59_06020 [Planctomycetaceae bacterium]|nr:hypothetical protein [Planctomycetaceae bacterium]